MLDRLTNFFLGPEMTYSSIPVSVPEDAPREPPTENTVLLGSNSLSTSSVDSVGDSNTEERKPEGEQLPSPHAIRELRALSHPYRQYMEGRRRKESQRYRGAILGKRLDQECSQKAEGRTVGDRRHPRTKSRDVESPR